MSDIEQIQQLSARYNLTFDEGDIQGWLACFTDDGVFERSTGGGPCKGKAALEEMGRAFTANGRHVTTSGVIHVDGDEAHQTCYLQYLDGDAEFTVAMFGVYTDRLARVDGSWLFASRYLEVLGP